MIKISVFKTNLIIIFISIFFLSSCNGKLPGADARKISPNPDKRVQKNLEEGRGFRIMDSVKKGSSGDFDFASSNELWRASLDTIDFMPLVSVNYSGGIIVTDWYAADQSLSGESVKISIRFLTNEVRADALEIKVFNRKCNNVSNCIVKELNDELGPEIKKQILKKASQYKKESKAKKSTN